MLYHRIPIPIVLSVVCSVSAALCIVAKRCKIGLLCVEVEYECGDDISVGTIFDALSPP